MVLPAKTFCDQCCCCSKSLCLLYHWCLPHNTFRAAKICDAWDRVRLKVIDSADAATMHISTHQLWKNVLQSADMPDGDHAQGWARYAGRTSRARGEGSEAGEACMGSATPKCPLLFVQRCASSGLAYHSCLSFDSVFCPSCRLTPAKCVKSTADCIACWRETCIL